MGESGSGDQAFAEAAERLLVGEVAARSSYLRRQGRCEEEFTDQLRSVWAFSSPAPTELVAESAGLCSRLELVSKRSAEVFTANENLRVRRIVGDDFVAQLPANSNEETQVEDALISSLRHIPESRVSRRTALADAESRFEERKKEMPRASRRLAS